MKKIPQFDPQFSRLRLPIVAILKTKLEKTRKLEAIAAHAYKGDLIGTGILIVLRGGQVIFNINHIVTCW